MKFSNNGLERIWIRKNDIWYQKKVSLSEL